MFIQEATQEKRLGGLQFAPGAAEVWALWGRCWAGAGAAAPLREPPRDWDQPRQRVTVMWDCLMSLSDLGTWCGKWGTPPGQGVPCQSCLFSRRCCTGVGEVDPCSQKTCRSEVPSSLSDAMPRIPLAPLLRGLTMHPKCSGMGKLRPQASSLVFVGC